MPNPSIKDEGTYQSLREKGYSEEKAARIANAQADRSMSPSQKGGEHPPYEEWTKEKLLEKAKDVGVEGRSEMSKDALIKALRG